VDPRQALHLVLKRGEGAPRSRGQASRESAPSLLHPDHAGALELLYRELAHKWGVRVYRYANVGSHLHFLLKPRTRRAWQGFLRELTGKIAMRMTGARKGLEGKFWTGLAFTRIVKFGRDFEGVALYLVGNVFESLGVPIRRLQARGYRLVSIGPDG
jgi:hypothetical protein